MTNFKAIVLDLDGTLLNDDGEISVKTKSVLQNEKMNGAKIILATGRPVNMTTEIHKELDLDTPMICLNGGVVYDRLLNQVISYEALAREEIEDVYNIVSTEANLVLYHTALANYQMKNELNSKIDDYFPIETFGCVPMVDEPILKISAYIDDVKRNETIKRLNGNYQIADWPDNFEVTKKFVTKWHGLQFVLNHLNISSSETVAFGDGSNDISMIKHVGFGVAMGNAILKLKAVADFVTLTNDEDGICQVLNNSQLISH